MFVSGPPEQVVHRHDPHEDVVDRGRARALTSVGTDVSGAKSVPPALYAVRPRPVARFTDRPYLAKPHSEHKRQSRSSYPQRTHLLCRIQIIIRKIAAIPDA